MKPEINKMKPEIRKPKTESGMTGDSVQTPVSGLYFRFPVSDFRSFFRSLFPLLLILCVALVVFWEVMVNRSRRPFQAFDLVAADFADFNPVSERWTIDRVNIRADDPAAPNLFALRLSGDKASTLVFVRLVHGYNMPDCMRLKGYKVELIRDRGKSDVVPEFQSFRVSGLQGKKIRGFQSSRVAEQSKPSSVPASDTEPASTALPPCNPETLPLLNPASGLQHLPRLQTWRLTSDIGDVSIACTAIIRATDFGGTDLSVLDMAFPRIAKPIGPEWNIEGFKLSSLRHPVKSLVMFFRIKWNNSRCDLLTFLRLRQPAWASSDYMTFLATSWGSRVAPGDEARVAGDVLAAHEAVYRELFRWRARE